MSRSKLCTQNTVLATIQSHFTHPSIELSLSLTFQRFFVRRFFFYLAMYVVACLGYEEETKAVQAYLDF